MASLTVAPKKRVREDDSMLPGSEGHDAQRERLFLAERHGGTEDVLLIGQRLGPQVHQFRRGGDRRDVAPEARTRFSE